MWKNRFTKLHKTIDGYKYSPRSVEIKNYGQLQLYEHASVICLNVVTGGSFTGYYRFLKHLNIFKGLRSFEFQAGRPIMPSPVCFFLRLTSNETLDFGFSRLQINEQAFTTRRTD